MAAYEAAMGGGKIEIGKSAIKPGTVADLVTVYYQTAAFLQLADATRQTYRGILERNMASIRSRVWRSNTLWRFWIRKQRRRRRQIICRLLRAIMKLAKRRKMIKTNPMIEIEPIRYKAKGQGNRVKGSCGNQADEELVVPGCDFTL